MDEAVETLTHRLNSLQIGVSSLAEMAKKIGTLRDGYSLRTKIHSEQMRCKALTKEILYLFSCIVSSTQMASKSTSVEVMQLKIRYEKTCQSLQELCNDISHRYTQLDRAAALPSHTPNKKTKKEHSEGDEESGHELMQLIPVTDEELIHEQAVLVAQVEKDVVELAELFKETAQLVENQGHQIDVIESNVNETCAKVEAGTLDVVQASRYDSGKVALFGAAIGGMIGGPAGVLVGMKSTSLLGAVVAGVSVGVGLWGGRTLEANRQKHASGVAKKITS